MAVDDGSETLAGDDSEQDASVAPSRACLIPIDGHPHPPIFIDDDGLEVGRGFEGLIAQDPRLSKPHFSIRRESSGWLLRVLGSTNKTHVEGRFLKPGVDFHLEDETVIRAADSVFIFSVRPCLEDPDHDLMPGRSPAMTEARSRIRRAAELPGPILILGETGTGKEYAARLIHQLAMPEAAQHVPVNCGALEASLAYAQLFGAEKGSFTDSKETKIGFVGEAQDGTLFLDEIGNLKAALQEMLLRFIGDGTYYRLGSSTPRQSTALVIAATNEDLDDAVADGRFRQDLLARLRTLVAPIELPPLRERREDIVPWARRMIEPMPMAAGCIECLLLHGWPENLRGLQRAMADAHQAATKAKADRIEGAHLPNDVRAARDRARQEDPVLHAARRSLRPNYMPTKEECENALTVAEGNMSQAAAALGVERTKFHRICKKYGLNQDDFRRK